MLKKTTPTANLTAWNSAENIPARWEKICSLNLINENAPCPNNSQNIAWKKMATCLRIQRKINRSQMFQNLATFARSGPLGQLTRKPIWWLGLRIVAAIASKDLEKSKDFFRSLWSNFGGLSKSSRSLVVRIRILAMVDLDIWCPKRSDCGQGLKARP